jgi:hypothetical protein
VSLGPNQTAEVDLGQLSANAKKRTDLNVVTVEVTNSGGAGSLIGSLYGINNETGMNYETPLRDSGPVRTMTGAYPWKVSDDYSTIVYITNISDREAGFIAQLNHDGEPFVFDPRKLQPGETAVFDLAQIRDQQVSDNQGRRLPKETSMGQFKWAVRGVTDGKLLLIGRAEMVSRAEQISTSYSCNDPCPPTYGGSIDPFLPPIVIVGNQTTSIWETAYYGSGVQAGPYSTSADWTVSNQLATCQPTSGHTVEVCGDNAGSGFMTAFVRYEESYGYDGRDCYDNNNQYAVADGQILDVFDLNLEFSPSEVQPSGTGGTSQTTVTLHTTPHAAGVNVSFSVQAQGDGGHVNHSGSRPLGTFTNASGNTDASGNYSTTFNASAFGGSVNIRATVQGQTATNKVLEVRIADLGTIATTQDWNLVGATNTHPDNHYGTATLNVGLAASARDYTDIYYGIGNHAPDADRLKFNDMSLINGGKFEIAGTWSTMTAHDEHRLGQNCDVFSGNVPTNRWSTLTGIFVNRGSPNYLDETQNLNHWHVRFTGP